MHLASLENKYFDLAITSINNINDPDARTATGMIVLSTNQSKNQAEFNSNTSRVAIAWLLAVWTSFIWLLHKPDDYIIANDLSNIAPAILFIISAISGIISAHSFLKVRKWFKKMQETWNGINNIISQVVQVINEAKEEVESEVSIVKCSEGKTAIMSIAKKTWKIIWVQCPDISFNESGKSSCVSIKVNHMSDKYLKNFHECIYLRK